MGVHDVDTKGRNEVVSSEPIAIPARFLRPPTMAEQVRALVKAERFAEIVASQGFETFEEADDFDVGDDFDPTSPYEMDFDQETYVGRDEGGSDDPKGPSDEGGGEEEGGSEQGS